MLTFSQVRETCGYSIAHGATILRHDVKCGDNKFNCSYFIPSAKRRKKLNPLTLQRYRNRSIQQLQQAIIESDLSLNCLQELPMPDGGYRAIDNGFLDMVTS